jgi:hypothetical protein
VLRWCCQALLWVRLTRLQSVVLLQMQRAAADALDFEQYSVWVCVPVAEALAAASGLLAVFVATLLLCLSPDAVLIMNPLLCCCCADHQRCHLDT